MPVVSFSHPLVDGLAGGSLAVHTGMDQIQWSYRLNTAHWPTYGGEVVQILSVFIDDMTIVGTCRSYAETERIYTWFSKYMMVATQGASSTGGAKYDQQPVTMTYPQRGWTFQIQPLTLPTFRYGRDVVAPSWGLLAHVVDDVGDYDSLQQMVVGKVLADGTGSGFSITGQINASAGDPTQDPFQAPGTRSGNAFKPLTAAQTTSGVTQLASYYSNLVSSYLSGDFSSLENGGSGPAFGSTTTQVTPQSGATSAANITLGNG